MKVVKRFACVNTFDVVGRACEGPWPAAKADSPYQLLRVTSIDGVLREAPGERDWAVLRLLSRIGPVERRMNDRRVRRSEARFAKGDVAYVAMSGEEVAAWAWVSLQPVVRCRWSGLRFTLRPGEAYLYDLWSFPGQRAAGAGAFVMRGMLDDLYERHEASRVYGYILCENRPSQVLHRLVLGFEQVQRISSVRILSHWAWQLPLTQVPRVGPCSLAPIATLRQEKA